ncbi:unnamed protein product, partial [Anisakis simplex]|uniref:Uncharacterized protein n=1 Tax=Anisakis simplex TaxID=6269 RepID=A0A0M3JP61_ANISI
MPYGPRGPLPPPPATSSSAVVVSGMHLNASMQLGQTSSAQQQQQQQTSSVGMIQSGGVMNVNVPGAMSARSLH